MREADGIFQLDNDGIELFCFSPCFPPVKGIYELGVLARLLYAPTGRGRVTV